MALAMVAVWKLEPTNNADFGLDTAQTKIVVKILLPVSSAMVRKPVI
jgi:hypothetical protein